MNELAALTLRRIQSGWGLLAMAHIYQFAQGVPVIDFVDTLYETSTMFQLPLGFLPSLTRVKTVDQLEMFVLYWSAVYAGEGWA